MIEADLRKSIAAFHERGMGIRQIARQLGISRNTVRNIIEQKGVIPTAGRRDTVALPPETLVKLFADCGGYRERVWEKLKEEHGAEIGYSTLTRKIRELGLAKKPRSAHVPDEPGGEMQHDTSPYRVKISGATLGVQGSLLYYRYSKQYFLKFYRSFNRFRMKCFFHEALTHFGYAAPVCIIDNTHLAVLRGTGKNAVMVAEMSEFARRYGFQFEAHEKGHADRKAGDERGFWTIVTNFFPGRTFSSMEDLNAQALDWATERMAKRPRGKSCIIPVEAFEYERAFLTKLPEGLPAPYRVHERIIDQYGFVAFDANHYWLPSGATGSVKILEYAFDIRIISGRHEIARYPLPPEGVRGKIFPENRPHIPYQPRHRDNPTAEEELILRNASPGVGAYLDIYLKTMGLGRHRFLRELHGLFRRLSPNLFCQVIERAHRFKVIDVRTLEEIARLIVREGNWTVADTAPSEAYLDRESFEEGRLSEPADFSIYERLLADDGSSDEGR
jgi:transposase